MEDIKILQRVAEMERTRYVSTGDYSATDLISPPRVVRLRKRYGHVATQPLASVIPSMMGTAMHEYVEKMLCLWMDVNFIHDTDMEVELATNIEDRRITGRYDFRMGGDLFDLKVIKAWKLVFDPKLVDFHEQQNIYSYLLYLDGIDLDSINIIAMYKDWQAGNALRDRKYPQEQVVQYQLDHWTREEQEHFIRTRLLKHKACEDLEDDHLPSCTRSERWERFPGGEEINYAIFKKEGAKKAAKVVRDGDLEHAMRVARSMKGITKDSFIEIRYAKRTRCEDYCSINQYCNDFKRYAALKSAGKLNDYVPII